MSCPEISLQKSKRKTGLKMTTEKQVNKYTDEEKLRIIQEYLVRKCTIKSIHEKYNIYGHCTISKWMLKFGISKTVNNQSKVSNSMKTEMSKSSKEQALELRIKELELQVEQGKMHTFLLNTMIDIAEEQLKVSIRKKYGAKQSKK